MSTTLVFMLSSVPRLSWRSKPLFWLLVVTLTQGYEMIEGQVPLLQWGQLLYLCHVASLDPVQCRLAALETTCEVNHITSFPLFSHCSNCHCPIFHQLFNSNQIPFVRQCSKQRCVPVRRVRPCAITDTDIKPRKQQVRGLRGLSDCTRSIHSSIQNELSFRPAPVLAATLCGPDKNYAVSCQPRLRLLQWVSVMGKGKRIILKIFICIFTAPRRVNSQALMRQWIRLIWRRWRGLPAESASKEGSVGELSGLEILIHFCASSAQTNYVLLAKSSKECCSSEAVGRTCRARRWPGRLRERLSWRGEAWKIGWRKTSELTKEKNSWWPYSF